eukprot:gene14173-biopygen5095
MGSIPYAIGKPPDIPRRFPSPATFLSNVSQILPATGHPCADVRTAHGGVRSAGAAGVAVPLFGASSARARSGRADDTGGRGD